MCVDTITPMIFYMSDLFVEKFYISAHSGTSPLIHTYSRGHCFVYFWEGIEVRCCKTRRDRPANTLASYTLALS